MNDAYQDLSSRVAHLYSGEADFESLALAIFQYQYQNVKIYRMWCDALHISPEDVSNIADIPFLPIRFFKRYKVYDESSEPEVVYTSSGTTGAVTSSHAVASKEFYLDNTTQAFEERYGRVEDHCFLCLLPNYLERSGSSLIDMCAHFAELSKYENSGFFLYDHDTLKKELEHNQKHRIPTVLIGVSYALLDFIEAHALTYPELIVMETGGMKGRRKEMTKAELQNMLSEGFGVERVHSEYGMTELLSQAYSKGEGKYFPSSSMAIKLSEIQDPLTTMDAYEKTGILNIIDLANIHSCSFIATEDLGRLHEDGAFSIIGRLDQADIRGCNLMVV